MFIFNSRFNTLTVVLRPVRRVIVGTQVVTEEGLVARFENGLFTTEDEDTAKLLREKIKKSRDGSNIIEITSEDELAFAKLKGPKNVREAVTAAEVSKVNPAQAKLAERSNAPIKCLICDKEFKDQRSLNIHLVSHRPDVQVAPAAQAPKLAEPTEDAG